jgi:PKHD-type hydroxylase
MKNKSVDGVSWVLQPNTIHPCAWMQGAFSWDECDEIIKIGKKGELKTAAIINQKKDQDINDIRLSEVRWVHPSEAEWIYAKMTGVVQALNEQYFGFDLFNFGEAMQFTEYTAPGGHYTWHTDMALNFSPRKLSIILQLTDPDEYEGGEFEYWQGNNPDKIENSRGTVIAFPSYMLHRIKPMISGTRNSLVAWISGPQFK